MAKKVSQAALPRGVIGHWLGQLMGWLNTDMERMAVDQLLLKGTEKVLELGFGSGEGLLHLMAKVPPANIAGVDPSSVMLDLAKRRLTASQGAIHLKHGSSADIPWADETFDAIVTVNNIQLWALPQDFDEIKRVLKLSGMLSVAVHGWAMQKCYHVSTVQASCDRLQTQLTAAGFLILKEWIQKSRSGDAIYFLARKP